MPRRLELETRLCPFLDARQGGAELAGFGSARLRHVGLATAFATHLLCDEVHQISRFDPAGRISRDTGYE